MKRSRIIKTGRRARQLSANRALLVAARRAGYEWCLRGRTHYLFFRSEPEMNRTIQRRAQTILRSDPQDCRYVNGRLRVGNSDNLHWFIDYNTTQPRQRSARQPRYRLPVNRFWSWMWTQMTRRGDQS